MLWLISAILAYLFLAVASVGDRFILVGPLPNPKVYAFLIAIMGGLAIPLLAPFGFSWLELPIALLSLIAGLVWIFALVSAFEATIREEVSRVVPAVGALVPIFTLIGTAIIWRKTLSLEEFLGFLLLLGGGFLITARRFSIKYFLETKAVRWIILTAVLFSAGFLLMKAVFEIESFLNGFIWMRIGGLIAGLILFLSPEVRNNVLKQKVGFKKRVFVPFLFFQACGVIGFLSQNVAINLALPSQLPLINAMEGVRYLFLFLLVAVIARWQPAWLKEEMVGSVLWQKLLASLMIISGIVVLTGVPEPIR